MSDVDYDTIMRVRRHECSLRGHDWEIVEQSAVGPVAVVCGNCDTPSFACTPRDAFEAWAASSAGQQVMLEALGAEQVGSYVHGTLDMRTGTKQRDEARPVFVLPASPPTGRTQ